MILIRWFVFFGAITLYTINGYSCLSDISTVREFQLVSDEELPFVEKLAAKCEESPNHEKLFYKMILGSTIFNELSVQLLQNGEYPTTDDQGMHQTKRVGAYFQGCNNLLLKSLYVTNDNLTGISWDHPTGIMSASFRWTDIENIYLETDARHQVTVKMKDVKDAQITTSKERFKTGGSGVIDLPGWASVIPGFNTVNRINNLAGAESFNTGVKNLLLDEALSNFGPFGSHIDPRNGINYPSDTFKEGYLPHFKNREAALRFIKLAKLSLKSCNTIEENNL